MHSLVCAFYAIGPGTKARLCTSADLTKAFDSVDREMAWQLLLSRGAPPKLVALIKDRHTSHLAIIPSEIDYAPVTTSVGFKQKYVLAPPLFNICLDNVICQLLPEL